MIRSAWFADKWLARTDPREIVAIHDNFGGANRVAFTPFFFRKDVHAAYAHRSRSLHTIEKDMARLEVEPDAVAQNAEFTERARKAARRLLPASDQGCSVVFATDPTGAVRKLIDIFGLSPDETASISATSSRSRSSGKDQRPLVILSPFKGETDAGVWDKYSNAEVHFAPLDRKLGIDCQALEAILKSNKGKRRSVIGLFPAACSVTGRQSQVDMITSLFVKYGAFIFWDYTLAAPFRPIELGTKHGIIMSPHLFPGGCKTSTILFIRPGIGRRNEFVACRESHSQPKYDLRSYHAINGHCQFDQDMIRRRESDFLGRALAAWTTGCSEIIVLGGSGAKWLPIVSFNIGHHETVLHHEYVRLLLYDLYGIDAVSTTASTDYHYGLLDLDDETIAMLPNNRQFSPGFVSLSFSYTMTDAEFMFIIAAVAELARSAWLLLPMYVFNLHTGKWSSRFTHMLPEESQPRGFSQMLKASTTPPRDTKGKQKPSPDFGACLDEARALFARQKDAEPKEAYLQRARPMEGKPAPFALPDRCISDGASRRREHTAATLPAQSQLHTIDESSLVNRNDTGALKTPPRQVNGNTAPARAAASEQSPPVNTAQAAQWFGVKATETLPPQRNPSGREREKTAPRRAPSPPKSANRVSDLPIAPLPQTQTSSTSSLGWSNVRAALRARIH